jgi:hypothetical protein
MLSVVSEMIEQQGAPTGRVDYRVLMRGLQMPEQTEKILIENMGIYRLEAMEREVVVRMMLGDGTKAICYHQS